MNDSQSGHTIPSKIGNCIQYLTWHHFYDKNSQNLLADDIIHTPQTRLIFSAGIEHPLITKMTMLMSGLFQNPTLTKSNLSTNWALTWKVDVQNTSKLCVYYVVCSNREWLQFANRLDLFQYRILSSLLTLIYWWLFRNIRVLIQAFVEFHVA